MRRFEAEGGGGGGGRHARKTVLLEALEPRMLLSADVSPFGGSGLHDDDALSMLVRDADDATSLTPEIVFLSTGGAQDVDYLGPVTIEDIDVAAFAAPGLLGGQESEILDALLASMEAAADDGLRFVFERPDAGDYATVHLGSVGGAFDAYGEYWGVAEHVDAGNVDRSDMAFVFSDVIDAALGLGEYVARLADVVLHEVGHLRGQAHDEHAHGAAEGPLADVAFDPKVHVAIGNQAADDAADGFVTIDGETYAVHPLIKDAMHADYRAFFNAGAVAGDGFPDVLMGQFAIHPVDHATWLTRVLDMAWKAQTDSAWDATERKQILAWSYGFLSHSAADHWAHTLVNSFAEGVAPGFGAAAVSIPTDQRDLGNMLRHFMTEAYIADSLPGFDANKSERTLVGPGDYSDDSTPAIAYDAPIRFIYEALLRAFPDDPTPMVEMAWEKGTLTANAGANTFVRSEGSFADDGFKVGHKITVANFGANDGEYFVTAVTDSGKTLTVNGPLAGGAATGDEKIFARVAKTASIAITADAETNTFTRTSGSFKTDGFVAGMRFDVLGFTSNARTYVVKTVTDTVITVEGALSTGSTNFSELVDESGTAQIVAYGQRGPALDNFFKLRDAVFKAAAAKGARGDVAELETIAADVITKLVNGTTIDQTTKDNLARAYLYNWADEIDEGVRHWGEFGLAFTKAMFDAGSRRDLQEKVGDATGFADSADSSTIRSKAEDGVGILDVLIEELDDPNGDGSTLDSFINLHLMPMAGLPAELGLLRSGLQALGEQLDTILQPIKEVFNPLKSAINDAKTYVKDLVKAQIEKKFGFSFEVFDFLKQLGNKMDLASVTLPGGAVVPIFKPGDHERLDAILGLPADHHEGTAPVGINKLDRFFQFYAGAEDRLDDNAVMGTVSPFAAFENAVTLSKMLLLMEQDPLGVGTAGDDQLSELYSDILTELQGGGPPVTYDFGLMNLNGAHGGNVLTATLPGVSGVDAQQIWMTSIDADQVWRHDNYTVDNALFRIGEFPGTSASHVVYTATNLAAGTYRIYASWQANVTQDLDNLLNSAHPDQKISPTDNAEYTVLVNGGGAKTTHLNQQLFANDLDDGGLGFEQLTFTGGNTFTVGAAGTIQIKLNILTGTGDEHVIAGPIMLVRDDGDADPDNDPRLRIENRRDPVTLAPVATLNQTYVEEDPSLWSDVKYEGGGGNNPLWESEVLRPVFRHLFADWANGALDFPDLGDAASDDPNTTAGIVGTPLGSHATPFGPEIPDNEIQIPIPQALEDAILGGLQGVVNFAKAIENAPPLSAEVPGIGKTLAQLIGLSSAVDRNVRMPVVNYFANDATPTFAEFARVVSPALGPWGPGNSNGSAFEIGIDLSRAFVAEDLRLDLGAALDSFGIEVDAALDVATSFAFVDKATLKLPRFSVGVDLSGALSASDRFYVRAESLHVHAEAHADDIDAQARVAFLSGGVENGTIDLVVDVRIDLDDGSNNDGRLTLGEIASTALSALATVTATGTLAGELPLVISGLTGLTGGSIGSILFGATDVFDTNTFFFDTTGLNADAFNFKNIDAAAIVTLIGQLADQLQDLKQSGALNAIEIPFVDGAVGAVLDFAELVSDGLLYDDGADNAKDGANKLLTDINEALASAGLGDVLIAQGDGTHIDFELLDRTADGFKIQVDAGDAGGFALLAFAPGAAVFETTHRATPGSAVLGSTAKMKVTVKRGSQETATSVTLTADSTDDNTGIGDDTAKLLRADNSATFRTAQDLVFRLATMLGVSNVVEYHGATDALLLKIGALLPRLEISDSFDLSFDVDLGVGDVTTDARVKLTADAGIDPDFVLGIYMGSNVPGAQQGMTGTTPLGSLNGNDGVQIQSAPALTASQPVASQLKPMDGDATFVIQVGEPILGVAIGPDNITLNDPTRNFIGRVFVGDKILNLAEGQLVDVMVVNANSIVTSGLTGPGANWTGDAYQVISKPHTVTVPKTATDGTMAQLVSAINTEIAKNTFLKDKIVAVADGNRLNFTAADPDVVKAFVVTSTAGDPANKVLGIPTSDLSEGALVGDALDTFELLGGDAEFRLTIAGVAYDVVVKQSATQGNATMLALLGDVVDALAAARRVSNGAIESVLSKVTVEASGTSLVLRIKDPAVSAVQFSAALDDPAVLELGLTNEFTLTKPTVKATKAVATVVGRLSSDVTLTITTTGGPSGSVTLDADDTATNTTVLSLVNDLNTALAGSVFAGKLQFDSSGNKLVLMAIDPAITGFTIAVSGASASVLGLPTVATPAENFDFDIRTSNGSLIRVEIPSNAADINAVLNAINNAPGNAGKVEVKINAGATGLLLIDKTFQPLVKDPDGRIVTNPNTHVFTVTPVNGSQAAGDLRIVGVDAASAANLDGRIDGGQLVGVKLTDRFFMRDLAFEASLTVETPVDAVAKANFGFVAVVLTGDADLQASLRIELQDPGTGAAANNEVSLTEFIDGLSSPGSLIEAELGGLGRLDLDVTLDGSLPFITLGSANITLDLNLGDAFGAYPDTATLTGLAREGNTRLSVTGDARNLVTVGSLVTGPDSFKTFVSAVDYDDVDGKTYIDVVSGVNLPGSVAGLVIGTPTAPQFSLRTSGLGDLVSFQDVDFDFAAIIDALILVADLLSNIDGVDNALNARIPLVDVSVNDLLAFADRFSDALADAQRNPAGALQLLDRRLSEAFGVDPDDSTFAFGLDKGGTGTADDVLKFELNLGAAFSRTLGVAIPDLELGLDFIDGAVDFGGSATLGASGAATLKLHLGIEIDEPQKVYLYDTSGLEGSLKLFGEDMAFRAALGPFSLSVIGGEASIEGLISADFDDLFPTGTSRVQITNPLTVMQALDAEVAAPVHARLPIYFPTESHLVGDITLWGDLLNLANDSPLYLQTKLDTLKAEGTVTSATATTLVDSTADFAADGVQANQSQYVRIVAGTGAGQVRAITGVNTSTDTLTVHDAWALTPDATSQYEIFALVTGNGSAANANASAADDQIVLDVSEVLDELANGFGSLSLIDQMLFIVEGVDLVLGGVQDALDGDIMGFSMPLIGDKLAGGANAIGSFRDGFLNDFRTEVERLGTPDQNAVKDVLFKLLGSSGFLLKRDDATGDAVRVNGDFVAGTLDDIETFSNLGTPGLGIDQAEIYWKFTIGDKLLNAGADIGLDLGIPGLGLETDGKIVLDIDWELEVGFGLSGKDGFFFFIDDHDELELNARVTLPDGSLKGTLGFLEFTAEDADVDSDLDLDGDGEFDGDEGSTQLTASFGIDIVNTGDENDERLGLSELGRLGFDVTFEAAAKAELEMTLGLAGDDGGFPEIKADFVLDWGIGPVSLLDPDDDFELGSILQDGLKTVAFANVQLDIGAYISDVIGPLLRKIQEVTEPVQPIIDIVTTPLPVLADLGLEITLLDIAKQTGAVNPALIEAIEVVLEVVSIVNDTDFDADGSLLVPFGDFVVYDSDSPLFSGPGYNFGSLTSGDFDVGAFANAVLDPNGPFGELISGLPSGLQDVLNEVGGVANEVISGLASSSGATGTKKPFSFPILESPSEVFGMLMGEPADLVVYDMPALDFKAEFSAFFSIFGPLGVSINLEAALTIDFAFGYDTQGFIDFAASGYKNPLLLANGLYIDDDPTPGVNDGDDPAELIFTGGLWAAAELNLGIARGGVGGGIFIGVDFNLFDNDDDGKIRLDELVGNFLNQLKAPTDAEKLLAPLAVFDVSGKVTAELFAFLKIDFGLFELDKKFNITPPVTLVDFDVDFFRPPVLASEQANGDLLLHIGDFAEQRLLGDTSDFGEHLFIEDAGDGFVNIWSDNIADAGVASKQKYKVSGRIIGAGGDGNDIIDMTGVTQAGVRYDLDGGVGEDQLTGGGAGGVMRGGLGDDTLQGGGGLDLIFGNEGNDTIGGGDGADILFGDHGEIDAAFDLASRQGFVRGVVTNTDGTDIIDGEGGDDLAFGGGGGQDELSGSGGADILIGDGGLVTYASPGVVTETDDGDGAGDKLLGGAGNDLLYGGPGNDELDGQADNDILFGGLGSDTLRGGTENDILFGDFGRMNGSTAVVIAGGEADTLFGDDGADKLYGGGGNDAMSGGAGDDWAWGGTGMDLMHGDAGDDRLFGESDNDLLHGDANNDYLEGGGGNDKAWGGSGDDTLVAGYGSDVLDGEAGNDLYRITARGGTTTELTTLYDSVNDGSIDQLTFVGTPFDDTVLLRAMADSYFPSLADKLNPLIDRYFNAVQPDRLAAMLQAFEDAYGPLDLPPGMREALTAEFQDGLLNGLVQAVRDNQDAGTLRDTLEQIVEDVLASDADSKLQAMELAIQAAYDAASLTVPADLFNDLTAAYQPTGNPKLNALKAAIAPYYVRESMFPRVAGLQWLVGEVFDGTAPNKLQAMKDAITAAYGAYGVPAGMFAALDAADIADLNALQDAIADHYAADPVPESAFTNTAFIAMINNGGTDVERFNYRNLEILSVNTIDGNDYVVLDDLLATASINLGLGNDRAQIGQVFRSERTKDFEGQPAVTGIRSGDEFTTVEITRGWLSNGVSVPTTISGNDGDDEFVVFRNVAVLNLNGNDGDDLFVVRAFALAGSTDSERARTDMKGDGGADTILYVLNAPVGIDGGDGFDTVRIIGTEFSDDFVVTDAGVFGAGLNVSYVNIEKLVVDGAEGDDRYFVLSTGLGVVTEIDGGLGSDTFFVGGNPSGAPIPVISNDLRGHSGIILHSIESGDLNWAGLTVPGLSVNVGDDDEPMILVEESGGSSVVWEGGDGSTLSGWDYDTYTIRLSRAPVGSIRIAVAPAPESEEDLARDAKNLEIWDPVALTWKSAVTLTITSSNWQGQEVRFRAAKDTGIEGRRYAFINHKVDVSYFGADKSYAEAQVLSPKVQIEDDDRDAVVVLPTGGNTTVLEGGFSDEVKVVLAKAPDGPVKVVMSVMNGDVTLSRSTLWFDNDDDADAADGELWSKFQTVTVDAASDADREGFHIDFVSFNVTSADDQSGTLTLTDLGNVVVAGVLTPVVGGFLQVDGDFDLPGVQDIPDSKPTTYVLLPHRPIASSVIVKVNGVTLDGSDDDRRYDVSGNTLRFRTASGAPELRTGKVEVSYSIADVGYDGLATPDIVVDLYDNDAPAVIVEHVGGTSTDVVEGSATGDKYRIRLTQAPTQVVTVKITPTETRTSWGANAYFEQQVLASLASVKFGAVADLANGVHLWSDWVEVTVTAIQDTRIDGNDTQVFAPDLQTVNKIRGPLIIEGAAGQGSLTLPAPLMMPWELNLRPSDGTVLAFDVATSPEGLETMQVSKAELDAVVERFKEDDPSFTLAKLVGKTLEMSFGPGTAVTLDTSRPRDLFDRFWLITSVQQSGDRYTLSLKNPTAVNPLSPTVIAPEAGLSRYAITSLSVNFFADERTQVDMMFMFDDDSVANDVGRLTSSDGVVLGMTGNQMLVETSALQAAADLLKTTITGLITKTLEISVGPGLGRSFQITGIDPVAGDGGVRLLTLLALPNDAGDDVSSPTNRSEFRIAGAERHGRITGFGMGPNVLVGTRPQGGGITYGDLEVVDVRLGTGNDTVTVDYATNSEDHTTPRSGDFHTITLLDTGDGDDTVHVRLIDGDTRLDGQGNVVYDGGLGSGAFSLNLGAGADKVTDLGSTRGIVVFGGAGKDDIATGSGNDIVFGDIGRVDYVRTIPVTVNGGTVDEVLTRLGHSVVQNPVNPKVTGATSNSLSDSTKTFDDPASLIGLSVQVISSDGHVQFRTIIGASGSQIFVDRAWDSTPVFDGSKFNSFYRISAYPEDQTDGQFRGPRLVVSMLPDVGDDDTVDAGGGDDIVIGGKGADTLRGGAGNDHVAGDHVQLRYVPDAASPQHVPNDGPTRFSVLTSTHRASGGADVIHGDAGQDLLLGGAFGDFIDGGLDADLVIGDNATLTWMPGTKSAIAPRYVQLNAAAIYANDGSASIGDAGAAPSVAWGDWKLDLDMSATQADTLLGDYLAGGGGDDQIFGQRGDDVIQGDGSIASAVDGSAATLPVGKARTPNLEQLVQASFEAETDGDDYVEGGIGDDVIFGNLGQDDLVGGSSTLFVPLRADRVDGSDTVYGGAGTDMARNDAGDGLHGRDADMILGDNGDILRLVNAQGAALGFTYDDAYGGVQIVVRAARLQDYTPGNQGGVSDEGTGDELHGESGDDFVYGMTGSDAIYGEAGDDDLIGGWGNDWISGGTGQDGILGDDGRLTTSRNGLTEPLSGVTVAAQQATVATGGNVQFATIHVTGELVKVANLTPFSHDTAWTPAGDEFGGLTTGRDDDILFGGLGGDWLHGGSGDDAISGAEALAVSFAPDGAGGRLQIDYYHPLNFGKVLAFNPEDLDGKKAGQGRAGEFALYDEYNPMRKILLGTNGQYSATGQEYFLNFSSGEGAIGGVGNDGDDKLFGDLGNDWIVGGTGRDNLYGGFGNDLLNADDVLTTNGGANDQPDTHATYEDRAFGGAGRDVLIGNTGGDRLIDWTGEFNSFLVPFSPFGNNTVSRTLQPGLPEFLYRLSRSDGADPTRAGDVPGADPLRNGEPWGELGLVLQSDAAWGDQHGGPADPEPGNTQTKRDVLRSASFANNQAEGFLPVVGTWSVKNGRYEVAPAGGTNGDALSIFNDADTVIPNVFEMQATINALKPLAGVRANAYLIFDYWSPTDFKFAGIDVSTNKLQIGQRTATGWNVLASANVQVKSGTDYVVLLKVNYNAATVTLGNVSVSYGFPQRFDRLGFAHPISDGITGVGANGAAAQIDNVVVQAPPGAITLDKSADFSAAQPASGLFAAPLAGTWTMVNGRFESTSAGLNAPSIDLMHDPVSPGALLEITTTLRTSGQGGVVFDVHSPTYFKFAMLSADGRQVIIGHRNGDTWTTDAVGRVSIAAGTDYKMVVTVRGGLVNVSINGAVVASKLYNEPGTDGRYGFIARSGLTSFNDVRVRSDDVKHAAAPALLMATSEVAATSVTAAATPAWSELQALADEARRRWALAGADAGALARMAQVSVQFGRLDGAALARYAGLTVTIDTDAAGHGWFVDATPRADEEFRRAGTAVVSGRGDAAGRIDLLSVIAHELGHAAGLDHEAGGVMAESLAPGVRSLPMPMDTAPALPAAAVEIDWATPLRKGLPAAPIGAKAVPAASVDDWRVKFVAGLGRADPNAALRLHLPVTGSLTKAA